MKKKILSFISAIVFLITVLALSASMALAATALKITKQPAAVVAAPSGSTAKVSVTAKGDSLKYTWYYKNSGASKYSKDSKNKAKTYSVKMSSKVNGRKVYCVVKDKSGKTVKTSVATLKMGNPAKITSQPENIVVKKNKTAKVTVKATGDSVKYYWYVKDKGASKFTRDTKNTSKTYSVKMTSKINGRKVYCIVKDKYGSKVQSDTVTLYMGNAAKITSQPENTVVAKNQTAKVTVKATGDSLKYYWYVKDKGASKYVKDSKATSKTYSVKMTSKISGRKVYCIVKDKYGTSVKSSVVTLTMGNSAKITAQPSSVTVNCGSTAKVTVKATGDSLKYIWYYKDAGAAKFSKDSGNTSKTYSVKMTAKNNGRQVYCVVKDKYGTSVQSKTVTLTGSHVYDKGVVTKAATCAKDGVKTYTCNCSDTKTEKIAKLGHKMGEWKTVLEPTVTSTGYERSACTRSGCTYYKDRTLEKLPVKWNITVNTGSGAAYKVGVAENGKYALETPVKVGYNFSGWKTENGSDFASSGVISGDIAVSAQWTLDGTDTFKELKERTEALVGEILITADITVTEPVFISHETRIYSEGNYTITRAADYAGDIFVVGRESGGRSATEAGRKAVLDLGNGNGVLTVDGNRDNVTVPVVGSLIFAADSANVNLYDGVRLVNNNKTGNDRVYLYNDLYDTEGYKKVGGSAVTSVFAVVNMYGGEISNNASAMEYTVIPDAETGADVNYEYNGCGGAIFNGGLFYMHGGVISDNEGLRGGAIYSSKALYLYAGTISGNTSTIYGGAISSSSSSDSDIFLGTESGEAKLIIRDNRSGRAGGAIYSSTCSPILIEGNTEFINNYSASSGGAVYTAGPLLIKDTLFDGNSCPGNGGAIYHHYSSPSYDRRFFEMSGSTLINNSAVLGGAVIFSASDAVADTNMGTYATITDCTFSKNTASSNGGAMYITRKGDVTIENTPFTENTAAGSGGAISMHSNSNVIITDSEMSGNTASCGGGININSGTVATLKNIQLSNNSAKRTESGANGNGGALYVFDSGVLNVDNVDFYNNSAENHAGALYLGVTELDLDGTCSFDGNTAGEHGGAIYLTYKTVKETGENGEELSVKYGARINATNVTFSANSAKAGGAISARTATHVNLNGSVLTNNIATGTAKDEGGGAIYANNNTVILSGTRLIANESAYYGGAITTTGTEVTISNSEVKENKGATGAALSFRSGEVNLTDVTVADNGISEGNGIVYATESAKLNLTRVTATGNDSYNGGVLYASGASTAITVEDCIIKENTAKSNGGAITFTDATVTVTGGEFTGNTAKNGGAIYTERGTLTINNTPFSENAVTANGGAICCKSAEVTVTDSRATNNKAGYGGAFYTEKGTLTVKNGTFTKNEVTSNGGAVDIVGTVANVSGTTTFTNNSAAGHGGAIYINYTKKVEATDTTPEVPAAYGVLTVEGGIFEGNTAIAGGAVSGRTGSEATFNGTSFVNNSVTGYQLVDSGNKPGKSDGDGEGGGAIYVGFGTVHLNNVTATGNEAIASEYVNDKQETKLYGFGGFIDGYQAKVYIDGSTISGNKAPSGGAINILGSGNILSINDTDFINNESTYINTVDYDNSKGGGAINASNATVTINESTFDGNSTNWYGGAAILSKCNTTIDKSVFTNSKGATGAALNIKTNSDVTISDTVFDKNISSYNGVIYANSSKVTISNVTATENKAVNGGVFYISGGSTAVTVEKSTLSGNNATNAGIAYVDGATISFTDTELTGNTAKLGGIAYAKNNGKVNIANSTVSGNTATSNGSVIYLDGAEATVTDTSITENAASNVGGIFAKSENAVITVTDCDITKNTAKSGAAIFAEAGAAVAVSGSNFTENTANNGAAIYSNGLVGIEISGSTFTKNISTSNGGAIYAYRAPMTLSNSTFTENATNAHGGAIYCAGEAITASGNNIFKDNSAVNHGGAIYVVYVDVAQDDGSKTRYPGILVMTDGEFKGNTALGGGAISVRSSCVATLTNTVLTDNAVEGYQLVDTGDKPGKNDGDGEGGGAIYVGFGTVNLNNVTATGNIATATTYINADGKEKLYSFGGVVDAYNGTVNINGGTYTENKAAAGGVVYARDSTVTVSKASFSSNESTYENSDYDSTCGGGAIAASGGTLNIDSSTFDSNISGYYGGAVHAWGTTVNVNSKTVFNKNKGGTGAALYCSNGSTVTVDDTEFTVNESSYNGVIYISGTLTMTNVTATDNTCTNGVLNVGGGTATVSGSTFSNNTSSNKGGAVVAKKCKMTLTDNTFSGNSAKSGGAILVDSNATVEISGGEFKSNSAISGDGGAILVADSSEEGTNVATLTANGVTFTENTASSKGGAISTDTTSPNLVIEITSCTFNKNKAIGAGGGAIEIQNGNQPDATDPEKVGIVIKNCEFVGNTSKTTGAVLEIRTSSTVKIDGITAKENSAGGNGGVVYVTSNFSRLYLTGTVTFSSNTAASGSFANLYNNGYSNPPAIYTTHSDTADWVAGVTKGSKNTIVFDLETLP